MVTLGVKITEDFKDRIDATAARTQMTTPDFLRAVLDVTCGYTDDRLNTSFDMLKRQVAMNDEGRRQLDEQRRVYETLRQQFIDLRSMNAARAARVYGTQAAVAQVAAQTGKAN